MKKLIYSIAAMLPMFAACNKAQAPVQQEEGVFVTIPVGFAADSKTVYSPDTDGKCSWVAGDKVATKFVADGKQFTSGFWYGDTNGVQIGADGKATVSAYFSYSDKNTNGKLYAAYPWNGTTSSSASNWERSGAGVITMPSEQNPTAVSFDPLADVMTSRAIEDISTETNKTETLLFRQRVGFMALSFTNTPADVAGQFVKKVTITANEDAALAGKLAIAEPADNDGDLELTVNEGVNSIVLNYSADIKLSELVAYACVLPGTFETLSFDVELKNGAVVKFAQRNVNVTIAEGMMIHPSVAYDKSKGDKAFSVSPMSYTFTLTVVSSKLHGETTDTQVTDPITKFGIVTNTGTSIWSDYLYFTSKNHGVHNNNPIGTYITKISVSTSGSKTNFRYGLATSSVTTGSSAGTTSASETATKADAFQYFAVSGHLSASTSKYQGNVSTIVIDYVVNELTPIE